MPEGVVWMEGFLVWDGFAVSLSNLHQNVITVYVTYFKIGG